MINLLISLIQQQLPLSVKQEQQHHHLSFQPFRDKPMIVHHRRFGAVVLHNKIWIVIGPQQSYQCINSLKSVHFHSINPNKK